MVSSYTSRNRLNKQGTGDNTNTWGDVLNGGVIDLIDFAADGWTTINPTGGVTLSTANGVADQARARVLKLVGASTTSSTTIPTVEKLYIIWNATTAVQTIACTGGGTSVAIQPDEIILVICDGINVKRMNSLTFSGSTVSFSGGPVSLGSQRLTFVADPVSDHDAATKTYVDQTAFGMVTGALPGQSGNGGKFLMTDGNSAGWADAVVPSRTISGGGLATGGGDLSTNRTIVVTAALASDVRGGSDASKAVTAAALMASSARQTLTDAATIVWNMASGYMASVTPSISGRTIGAPTNVYDGLACTLEIINSAGGALSVNWSTGGGGWAFGTIPLPAMPTTAGAALLVSAIYNGRTSKWDVTGYRTSAV